MDKTLENYTKKTYIERISNKLHNLLRYSTDTEFLEKMCYNSNAKIYRTVFTNKNLAVSTMDKLLSPANYFAGELLINRQRGRVPISSLVKFSKIPNEGEEDYRCWQRLSTLKRVLYEFYPYLTHLYPKVIDSRKEEHHTWDKMRMPRKRIHWFL